jgi:broad specificity phosphatase PhoE
VTVYVLRHGETAWSRDRRHTGSTDVPLLGEGRTLAAQAGRLLVRLRGEAPWALVLTSPLARARETATLAGFPAAESDERLREWDYGDHEGRTTEEIQVDSPAWWLWSDGAAGGEDAAAVGARVDLLLEERVRPQTGDVLLVAHSHLLRVLTARWLGLPPAAGAMIVLDPAGIGVLGTEHERPALLRWNLSPAVAGA